GSELEPRPEGDAAALEKDVDGLITERQLPAVEPGEIPCRGRRVTDARQVALDERAEQHAMAVEQAHHVIEPFDRVAIRRDAGHDAKGAGAFPRVLVETPEQCAHRRRHGNRLRALQSGNRSEEHTSELQSLAYLVCRLLL